MPNDIENRVVKMSFDNKSFEQGAAESMKTLSKLKDSLDFNGIADKLDKSFDSFEKTIKGSFDGVSSLPDKLVKGFDEIKDSIGDVRDAATEMQSNIGANIEAIAKKFESLTSVVGKVADKIKNDIANKIKNTLKDMTVGQINAGMTKYEKETRAVQTITNATGKTAAEVDEVLKTLMKYTDETSYDFAEMVSSIGKFTSVGVDLNLAEKAMEGIANEAAKSGAGVQEANRAMYNFAQALSAGYVKLIDWKSIENANMATKEFKEQLIETAIELGTLEKKGDKIGSVVSTNEKSLEAGQAALKKANKATKDRAEKVAAAQKKIADATKKVEVNYKTFNETLSSKWLTSDVLVKTLEKYSDTSTEFGLAAFHAAQEALTFKDVLEATKDAISSGWMQTYQYLFGNLDEARVLWTKVANSIYDFVAIFSEARNELLGGWHELGGYNMAVEAASNIWHSFMDVLYAVKDAWENVFPPLTAERLVGWTAKVRDLTAEFRNLVGIQESLRDEDDDEGNDTKKSDVKYYIEYGNDVNKAWNMTKELKKGDIGDDVKALQNELKNANYLPKKFVANGIFNKETEEAVKQLQKHVGTKVTGAWDKATRAATWAKKEFVEVHAYRQKITEDWISEGKTIIAIYNKQIDVAKKLNNTINKSSRKSDIKELQEALIKAGYLADKNGATGIYGPETELAVKQLQAALRVEVTGSWDEATKAAASAKKVFTETKEVEEKVDPTKYARDAAKAYTELTEEQEKALEANRQLSKALSKTGTHLETDNWFAKGKDIKKYTNKEGKSTYFYELDSNVDINSLKNLQKASVKTESDLVRLDQKAKVIKDTTLRVQNALVHYGYLADSSLANGIYGPETKEAVKNLQKDLGVKVTGAWDTATQVAVRESDRFNKEITKTDWRETLIARIQEYVKGFASAIDTVKKIVLGAVRFVAGIGTMLKPLIDPILRLVTFISKMFQNLNKGVNNNKVYGFIDNILMLLKPVADVIRWIGNAINGFLDGYRKYIAGLEGGIVRVGKNGKKTVNSGLITFKTFFDYIIASFKNSPVFGFILKVVETVKTAATLILAIVAKILLIIINKIAAIKKAFDEFLSIDGIEGKLKYLQDIFTKFFTGVFDKLSKTPVGKIVIGWFDSIKSKLSGFIKDWQKLGEIEGITGKLQYIFNLLKGYIGKIVTYLSGTEIGKFIGETFDNIRSVISSKIAYLGEEIRTRMSEAFEKFKDSSFGKVILDIYTIVSGIVVSIVDKFNEIFPNFKSGIATAWSDIVSTITNGSMTIAERLSAIVEIVKSLVAGAFDAIKSKWEQLKQAYPIINTITSTIIGMAKVAMQVLSGITGGIASFFKGSSTSKSGEYATEGLAKGMLKGVSKVADAGVEVAKGAVEAITGPKGLDEHSPSKVTEEAGQYATQGLAKGMLNSKGQVETAATNVANSVEKPFAETSENISNELTFSSVLDKITNEVKTFIKSISEMGLEDVINIALKALSIFAALKAASGIKKFGKGFLEAGKGFKESFGKISESINTNLTTVANASKAFILGKEGNNSIAQIIEDYRKAQEEAQNKANEESGKDPIGTTLLKIAGSLALIAATIFAISKVDTKDLIKGGIALGAIATAIILCVFALSKIKSENIEKLGEGLLELSKGIGLLVLSILGMNIIVANTSGETLMKSIGIIAGFLVGLSLLEALLTKAGSKSKAGVVDVKVSGITAMCGGIEILVIAIGSMVRTLKKYGTGDVLLALDSIKSLLTRLGIIEVILAFLGKSSRTGIVSVKISGMLNMCLGIYILSMAVEKMAKGIKNNEHYDEAFDMVGSLLFKLGALETILTLLNIFNKGTKVKIGGILAMAAGIYLISMAIGKIAADYEKFKSYEEAFDLLSSILWTLSIVSLLFVAALGALSAIGIGGALNAVGALVIFFGVTTGLGLLVGAINNWTNGGLLNLLVEGGKTIGAGIGAFINAFTSGVNEGKEEPPSFLERLKSFATGLSDVMDDLKPFFEKCESITRKQSIGVGYLISAILKMTGSNMVDAVSSWVGEKLTGESSGSGFVDFASNLVTFADYIIEFADKIAGTEVDGVKTGGLNTQAIEDSVPAIRAMDALAQACAGIAWGELKTKVFEVIAGDNSIVTFAEKMVTAAPKIKEYGEAVDGLKVQAIQDSATVLEALGSAASAIPGADGLIQQVFGNHDIEKFGNSLGALGTGLSNFVTNTKDIPSGYDATPFTTALEGFATVAQKIPAANSWIKAAFGFTDIEINSGDKSLDTFGNQLGQLGTGLSQFVTNTSSIDKDYDASHLISVLTGLTEVQNKIYGKNGTISKFFGGEKDLGVFGDEIVTLAGKLKTFETDTKSLDTTQLTTVGTALSTLANAVLALPQINNATGLIYTAESIFETLTEQSLFDSGKTIMDHIVEGINAVGNDDEVFGAINGVLSEAIKKVNATYSDMKTSPAVKPGEYVDDGLVKGIENNAEKVSAAILKVVNDALAAAKGPEGLDEHSPSKVTEEMGEYAGEGLATGLDKSTNKVTESAENLAGAVTDGLELPSTTEVKNSAEQYADAYAEGLDAGAENVRKSGAELNNAIKDQNDSIENRKVVIGSTNYTGSYYYYKTEKEQKEEQEEKEQKEEQEEKKNRVSVDSNWQPNVRKTSDWQNRVANLRDNYDSMNKSAVKGVNTNSAAKTLADNTADSLAGTDMSDAGDALTENLGSSISKSLEGSDSESGPFSGLLEHLGEGITNLFSGDNPDNPLNGLGSLFDGDNPDNPLNGIKDMFSGLFGDGDDSIWKKITGIVDPNNPDNPFSGVMDTLGGFLTGEGGIIEKVKNIFSPENGDGPLQGIYDTIAGFLNPDNPNGLIKEGKRLVAKMFGLDEGEEAAETAVDGAETVLKEELDSEKPNSTMAGVKEIAGKSMTDALSAQDDKKVAANMTKSAKALNNVISSEVDRSPTITPVIDYSQINGSASEIRSLIGIDDVATSINAQNSGALATSAAVGQVGNILSDLKGVMDKNHKSMNGYLEYMSLRLDTIDEDLTKLKIYLDSDAIVAGTVDKMDKAMGKKYFRGSR